MSPKDGVIDTARPARGGLFAWFVTNHVAANLFMLLLLLGGGVLALRMKVEVLPEIDPRTVTVSVVYPGATPAEVEEGISRRVEEAITGIEGIERVRSVSSEGNGLVTAELEDDADDREVLDDIKSAVEAIQNFPPADAEDPRIADTVVNGSVLTIALYGAASERTLRELAFRLRDDLTALDGVSLVDVQGVRDYEVAVEVSERALRERGLSFEQVAAAVTGFSVNLPGGSIRTAGGEILLRTENQAYDKGDFERLVVFTSPDGTTIRLADVAEVRDGFEDIDQLNLFNGQPAAFVAVSRVGDQRVLDVESTVLEYMATIAMPTGVESEVWGNRGDILRSRIDLLLRNGLMGLILVFGVLVLFVDLRLAFWTTAGIPISFLGAFVFITLAGGSINMISLFAFILVLGIVVDDAIVVGENIYAKREAGLEPVQAAIEGLREVVAPVGVGVLTTIIAFAPLYFTEGFFGDILWVVPIVVIGVLTMSIVESFLILPAHLSGGSRRRRRGTLVVVQEKLQGVLRWVIERVYEPVLRVALKQRYATVAVATALVAITGGLVVGGHVRFLLFPQIDADDISVRVTMAGGTPAAETLSVLEHLAQSAREVREELDAERPGDGPSVFQSVSMTLGSQPFGGGGGPHSGPGSSGSNTAEVAIQLLASENRDIAAVEIVRLWRERVGEIPGATAVNYTSSLLSAGDDISVELAHADFDQLFAAAERTKSHLAEFDGVDEISDSFEPGKRELDFELTETGIAAGLTASALARQVRQAYYGVEAQRVQRGRDEVKVLVRYSEAERRSLQSLDDLRVRLPDGTELPLATVARYEEGRGYATIDRTDRRRVVNVTADVDDERASAGDVNADLRDVFLPALQRDLPGLTYSFEGAERERIESLQSLLGSLVIALFGIFALIATQLRSYSQPLIIMSVIPLGIVGAVFGHMLLGFDLSFFSMFGVVALAGVVINDSLVLLDMINRLRREGKSPTEAALEAGARRFRPILFTTITTCAGLAPMIVEKSLQAQFLIPMAISLSSGVAFATLVTLVLVPALTLIREDVIELGRRAAALVRLEEDEADPAPAARP
ncbi:MAG: efflux RND transporter permease subunit [bacterium]|nr:efflux RND transporter permease subunit [bacterium]